jgi:hypothetical protein
MHFDVVDTESAYGRLLDAPDAEARETIFREELVEPFIGLVKRFGGIFVGCSTVVLLPR